MKKIKKTDQEWKEILTEEEYYITRQKGTEPAFSGKAFEISKDGVFKCRCCGAQLFEKTSKYELKSEIIERDITQVLEDSLAGISDIKEIKSEHNLVQSIDGRKTIYSSR